MDENTLTQTSALIIGAGPVGALLALALNRLGWQVTLVEQHDFSQGLPASYDNRQLALTAGSIDWLKQTQLLPLLMAELTPILSIHSSAQNNLGTLSMTHSEMDVAALGYTLSQERLGRCLFAMLKQTTVQLVDAIQPQELTQTSTTVSLTALDKQQQLQTWHADYLFAADGAHSWTRQQLNIKTQTRYYPHQLLTAIATLSEAHNNLAIERFTAQGPTALLPIANEHQAKVVYCYPVEKAEMVKQLSTKSLIDTINYQLGRTLGKVITLEAIVHYPLVEIRADSIQQERCLLVGNAAHTQHPVAGQGLNLGIRDIQAVYQWAQDCQAGGWQALAKQRQGDHQHTMNFTHGLVTLFGHPSPLVRRAASASMGLLTLCRPLKNRITRMAMGY